MKRKLIICGLIIFSLVAFSWFGMWLAHTRIIGGGLTSLKTQLIKKGITLEYGDLDFSTISPLHLKAEVKNIIFLSKERGSSHEVKIDSILLDSDFLNKELSITLIGKPTSRDTSPNKTVDGIYEFKTPPVVKCSLKMPFVSLKEFNLNNWFSASKFSTIKFDDLYYIYSKKEGNDYLPFTQAGPVSALLENASDGEKMNVDVDFKFLNHLYIAKKDINENELMQEVYKIIEDGGASNITLKVNLSNETNEKLSTESVVTKGDELKFINAKLIELNVKNNYYEVMLGGEILKEPKGQAPSFALNLNIKGFDKMVSTYTTVIDLAMKDHVGGKPDAKMPMVKDYSVAISETLKDLSLSSSKDELAITIFHKEPEFSISNTSLLELIARVQSRLKVKGNASNVTQEKVAPW